MKTYYKSIMAINLLMICISITMVIIGLYNHSVLTYGIGSIFGIYWVLSTIYTKKDYDKGEFAAQKEEAEELKKELDAKEFEIKQIKTNQTIYSQFSSLTKEEILWLHGHVEDQKTALIQVNTTNRENYVGIINAFDEHKMFQGLAEESRKELQAWDEFYLENSNMIASILPKLELIKEAVS